MEEYIEESDNNRTTYTIIPDFCRVDNKGKVTLYDSLYLNFLENYGFCTVRNGDIINLVRIQGNIITKVIPTDVKRFVIDQLAKHENQEVIDYVIRNRGFCNAEYLNLLREVKPQVIRDEKDKAFFFYKNGVVRVTKDGVKEPVSYNHFGHLVWSHHIKERDFNADMISQIEEPVFLKFLIRLTNNNRDRLKYLMTLIGYALHNYRTTANTRAIILTDEIVSDQPEGGSGKSLLAIALGQIRELVKKDGKSFNPLKSFEWSDVDESTDLVLIDETSKSFALQDLFSVITMGISVERKNKDKYHLPIEKSPIIIITTNSLVNGHGGSFKRRQYSADINQYFSHSHTPIDEYGHTFFLDWDNDEWARFDAFMLFCVQIYLKKGVLPCFEVESKKKDAIRATGSTFYEWFEEVKHDLQNFISTNIAKDKYVEETGQRGLKLSAKKFLGYIKMCCEIFGYEFHEERTSQERGFRIQFNQSI